MHSVYLLNNIADLYLHANTNSSRSEAFVYKIKIGREYSIWIIKFTHATVQVYAKKLNGKLM